NSGLTRSSQTASFGSGSPAGRSIDFSEAFAGTKTESMGGTSACAGDDEDGMAQKRHGSSRGTGQKSVPRREDSGKRGYAGGSPGGHIFATLGSLSRLAGPALWRSVVNGCLILQ